MTTNDDAQIPLIPTASADEARFMAVKPPYPYVGGKTKMLAFIRNNIPEKFGNYFEPFLGGGAVALEMLRRYPDKVFYLSDYGEEVITTWKAVRDFPEEIVEELEEHRDRHSRDYFFSIRDWDRNGLLDLKTQYERAGRMIYLCTVSFGGGYKVGKDGNTKNTFGKDYFSPPIANIRLLSELLNSRKIVFYNRDFKEAEGQLRGGDFIYLDPPYATDSTDAEYTISDQYAKADATQNITAQVRWLMDLATDHGAYALMSNTSTPTTERLWEGWHSITKSVVWTSGGVSKDGTRKTNKERMWANLHLFRALAGQGHPVDELDDTDIELQTIASEVESAQRAAALAKVAEIAAKHRGEGSTERDLEIASSLEALINRQTPDASRTTPTETD